jgi:hypothetical protein
MDGEYKMKARILGINTINSIGLSRNSKPIQYKTLLWSSDIIGELKEMRGSNRPAAFILAPENSTLKRLKVKVSINELHAGSYTLEAYDSQGGPKPFLKGKKIIRRNNGSQAELIFEVKDNLPNRFFQRVEGDIQWKLFYKKNNAGNATGFKLNATYLELFWIHEIDKRLFFYGVPVEILRQAAYAKRIVRGMASTTIIPHRSNSTNGHLDDPVISAIATVCFMRNPPRYDSKNRRRHIIKLNNGFDEITFELKKYIKSIYNRNQKCNCHDMAAVVQVHLQAVGIQNVTFCYINYSRDEPRKLNLTNLIGRGLSNILTFTKIKRFPFSRYDRYLVVDEDHADREKVVSHAFCCIKDDEIGTKHDYCEEKCKTCRILDACFGPHNGNDDIDTYIKDIFEIVEEDKTKVELYDGVTHIKDISRITKEPELPHTENFKNNIIFGERKSSDTKFIVASWQPWPLLLGISEINFAGWDIFYENTIPGKSEVMKTWQLRKRCEFIEIEFHVFSNQEDNNGSSDNENAYLSSKAAQYRFVEMGSNSTDTDLPYTKGPAILGRYSAKYIDDEYSHYFWTIDNMTFSVTAEDTSMDIETLCLGISKYATRHRQESMKDFMPSLSGLKCKHLKKQKSDEIEISLNSPGNVFLDCATNDIYLQLISMNEKKITLISSKKGTQTFTVTVVDKDTLLVNSKDIEINITE